MKRLTDTSPEAERVLYEACRRMSFAEKWRQMGEIYRTAKGLHAAGMRHRNPHATEEEIHESWMQHVLSDQLVEKIKEGQRGKDERRKHRGHPEGNSGPDNS